MAVFGNIVMRNKLMLQQSKDNAKNIKGINKSNIKYIGSTNKYEVGDENPTNRTFPYNTIKDAAFSVLEAVLSKKYCDDGYLVINNRSKMKDIVYIYKVDTADKYHIMSVEFEGTCKECIDKFGIPVK